MALVEEYSPSKKWRPGSSITITMLSLAGNQSDEYVPHTEINYLHRAGWWLELQGYAMHRLYSTAPTC
jgi:hypothetical protein